MFRRSVAVVLSLSLVPHVTGCYSTQIRGVGAGEAIAVEQQQIVALTTTAGTLVELDPGTASIRNDMLTATVDRERYVIALDNVDRVWLRHRRFNALATIGVTVGVLAVGFGTAVAIAIATKESCPFVYSWDGTEYVFDAEPYGGAVTRGLERDDYAELESLRPHDGLYRLLLTNEVNERQFTNFMELWVVEHPLGTQVIADEWGGLYAVRRPVAPSAAVDQRGRDLLPWLRATDRRIWEPLPEPAGDGSMRDDIILTFPKPEGATTGRLVARVATGLWGSHMIREMLELRGREVAAWYASLDSSQAAYDSLFAWIRREELFILALLVEESDGWRARGSLPGGGPFITETRLVSLDLSRVPGEELRIRIRPPRGFWALNSFAMDYGENEAIRVDTIPIRSARDRHGVDVRSDLEAADERYHAMPETGDWSELTFDAPRPTPGMERTVFLHSRGYYRLNLAEEGPANHALLREIEQVPDAGARLAAERYRQARLARLSAH